MRSSGRSEVVRAGLRFRTGHVSKHGQSAHAPDHSQHDSSLSIFTQVKGHASAMTVQQLAECSRYLMTDVSLMSARQRQWAVAPSTSRTKDGLQQQLTSSPNACACSLWLHRMYIPVRPRHRKAIQTIPTVQVSEAPAQLQHLDGVVC